MQNQDPSKKKNIFGLFIGIFTSFFAKKYTANTIKIENNYENRLRNSLYVNRLNNILDANFYDKIQREREYQRSLQTASRHVKIRNLVGIGALTAGVYATLYNLYKLTPYSQPKQLDTFEPENSNVSSRKHAP